MNGKTPRRRWFQYSLRTLLLTVFVCSILCSWLAVWLRKASRQRDAAESIMAGEGCELYYDQQGDVTVTMPGGQRKLHRNSRVRVPWGTPLQGPATLAEHLFGEHFTRHIVAVDVKVERVDEMLPHLKRLPYLQTVNVLPPNKGTEREQDAAIQRVKDEIPGIDVIGVVYDFNLGRSGSSCSQ